MLELSWRLKCLSFLWFFFMFFLHWSNPVCIWMHLRELSELAFWKRRSPRHSKQLNRVGSPLGFEDQMPGRSNIKLLNLESRTLWASTFLSFLTCFVFVHCSILWDVLSTYNLNLPCRSCYSIFCLGLDWNSWRSTNLLQVTRKIAFKKVVGGHSKFLHTSQ